MHTKVSAGKVNII